MHVIVGGVLVLCINAVPSFLGLTDACNRWWCVDAMYAVPYLCLTDACNRCRCVGAV